MNPVQSQLIPSTTFAALPFANAATGGSPSTAQPQSIRAFMPSLTPDVVQSPAGADSCGTGAASDPSQQGGFLGLIQNLLGQLGSYIQSLGGGAVQRQHGAGGRLERRRSGRSLPRLIRATLLRPHRRDPFLSSPRAHISVRKRSRSTARAPNRTGRDRQCVCVKLPRATPSRWIRSSAARMPSGSIGRPTRAK
jgi:hypothetical protein